MDEAALVDEHDDVVQDLEPFGSLGDHDIHDDKNGSVEDDTSAMIAEATAAAIASATAVDVIAVDAAALAAESAANLVDAAGVPVVPLRPSHSDRKNEQRRKRYRERILDEEVYDEEAGEASKQRPRTASTCHGDHLASRRAKDRDRYANMTPEEREAYNARRRSQYGKQPSSTRQRRRERERIRYHNFSEDDTKERNARRAELERERYKKLSREVLDERNRKRRERAMALRLKKMAEMAEQVC